MLMSTVFGPSMIGPEGLHSQPRLPNDYRSVSHLPTSHAVFEELRKTHTKQGLCARMVLIKKAMEIRFRPDVPLSETVDEIYALHTKIVNMGPIDDDELLEIFLLNALNDNFENIQSYLMSIADDPSFSSETIERRLRLEGSLIRIRAEKTLQTSSTSQGRARSRPVCANCKKPGHLADFCVRPGGKIAGRSINDARAAAQRLYSYHS
jgi:hypothetical protein